MFQYEINETITPKHNVQCEELTIILSALASLIPLICMRLLRVTNATASTVYSPPSSSFFMSPDDMPLPWGGEGDVVLLTSY